MISAHKVKTLNATLQIQAIPPVEICNKEGYLKGNKKVCVWDMFTLIKMATVFKGFQSSVYI